MICHSNINDNNVRITIKHIKSEEGTVDDIVYNMSGGEINVYYFDKLIIDDKIEWKLLDTKFNFNYREVIKHEKKDMETIRDEFNPITNTMEPVRVSEETLSLYFRDSAVSNRVTA